jgi:hypothetical protein
MYRLKKKYSNVIIFFYFFTFLIIGTFTAKDYGVHIEEKFHRSNGFYWLNYVLSFTDFTELKTISINKFNNIGDYTLSAVSHFNKYGIIFDLPAAYLEILFNINNSRDFYQFRHLLSFFFFFVSTIFFYKILLNRFKNKNISLIGTTFFILSPRIYGDSFLYKDIIFLSISTIAIYFFFKTIDKFSYKNLIIFAFFSALSTSSRIMGIYLPIMFLIISFFENLNKKQKFNFLIKNLLFLFFFTVFLIIHWPYLWSDPVKNFLDIFKSLKVDLVNFKILFNNNYISTEHIPYKYLPVWVIISTPTLYIIFFLLGFFYMSKRFIMKFLEIKKLPKYKDLWLSFSEKKDFVILCILSSIFIFVIIHNIKLYNGWRLMYFLNTFFMYIATYFIYIIYLKIRPSKIKVNLFNLFFLVTLGLVFQKMTIYHPYQSLYFNNFLSAEKKNSFEGDYHGLGTSKALLEIIKANKDSKNINIAVASHTPLQRGIEFLDPKDKKKINIVGQEYLIADYIYKNNISEVDINSNKKYVIPVNFKKIIEYKIDGIILFEIYKKL